MFKKRFFSSLFRVSFLSLFLVSLPLAFVWAQDGAGWGGGIENPLSADR